jgi:hypothetical protein
VKGLEAQQLSALRKIAAQGVRWKHPSHAPSLSSLFSLSFGGEVETDGNCLFNASLKAMEIHGLSPRELRLKTVEKFTRDYESSSSNHNNSGDGDNSTRALDRDAVDSLIRNLYCPDLSSGWGIHVVQEIKLIAKKSGREALDSAIAELEQSGMPR